MSNEIQDLTHQLTKVNETIERLRLQLAEMIVWTEVLIPEGKTLLYAARAISYAKELLEATK